MGKEKQRKNKSRVVYLWVLSVLILLTTVGGVYAKYIQTRQEKLLAKAELFYFSSNYLKEGGTTYELNATTTEITVTLRNYEDEWRKSENPVKYTLYINGEKHKTGTLNGETPDISVTIPVEPGKTYEVRAEGSAGYEKTLSATFHVQKGAPVVYKHLDTETDAHYILLTVWTEDLTGKVTVATDREDLIPDNTDPKLTHVINYAEGKYGPLTTGEKAYTIGRFSSTTYRFFKDDLTETYSVEDFTVTVTYTENATEKTVTAEKNDLP